MKLRLGLEESPANPLTGAHIKRKKAKVTQYLITTQRGTEETFVAAGQIPQKKKKQKKHLESLFVCFFTQMKELFFFFSFKTNVCMDVS